MANLKKKITLSLNEETLERLDQIAKEKYRSVDRTKAIRWMIDDIWEDLESNRDIRIAATMLKCKESMENDRKSREVS